MTEYAVVIEQFLSGSLSLWYQNYHVSFVPAYSRALQIVCKTAHLLHPTRSLRLTGRIEKIVWYIQRVPLPSLHFFPPLLFSPQRMQASSSYFSCKR